MQDLTRGDTRTAIGLEHTRAEVVVVLGAVQARRRGVVSVAASEALAAPHPPDKDAQASRSLFSPLVPSVQGRASDALKLRRRAPHGQIRTGRLVEQPRNGA